MPKLEDVEKEKFCLEYINFGDATQAYLAIRPHVQKRAASVNGHRWLQKENVQARIAELQQKIESPKIMDATERREKLSEIARSDETNKTDVIRAVDTLNKMDGLYINKTQLSGANGGALVFKWEGE